jgi:hypothetical protein
MKYDIKLGNNQRKKERIKENWRRNILGSKYKKILRKNFERDWGKRIENRE